MSRKRRFWIIIIVGIIITLLVSSLAFRLMLNCCVPIQSTELTANSSDPANKTTVALFNQTQTAAYIGSQLQTAYATMTLEDFIGTFDAEINLSLTPNPFTADISPTAPSPTIQIVTATATAITPSPTPTTNS